jgi:hypothetical protein
MVTMMIQDEPERRALSVRLPHDIKVWLENEAARDDRSQSTIVVRILRARMNAKQPTKAG